jgi:hypothetical protein
VSPEAQRIAFAQVTSGRFETGPFDSIVFKTADGRSFGDPLSDLDAMHEAEKVLTPPQSERYAEFILDVLEIPSPFIGTARCAYLTAHANAAQRLEAFLRTFGKWEDGK